MRKAVAIAVFALVSTCGCNSKLEFETAPVSGRVTLNGSPVTSGMVYFIPARGRGARGEITSDGSYTLSTFSDRDGAIVGWNKVFILAIERDGNEIESIKPAKSLIPHRYSSPETSGFEFEVKGGQSNEIPLSLTK